MADRPSIRSQAWGLFDQIVREAAPEGNHTNPWMLNLEKRPVFEPDYETLERLLGVPLHLRAGTQSGVPALALDVWLSYEMRRAGFDRDQVWPRPTNPRILPAPVAGLIKELPAALKGKVQHYVASKANIRGVTSAAAAILGKNYLKQVDVIMTDWATGPELLISTKRMDSSYGKNAPNRVEESYGDAKNLRLRHPLAALGFVFGLRSDILTKEPKTADWLFDLLEKLGREDDAYHATCLVLMEYGDASLPDTGEDEPDGILEPGPEMETDELPIFASTTAQTAQALPTVKILRSLTPDVLSPGRFLGLMVERVLDATPVNMHEDARQRRKAVLSAPTVG